MEASPTAHFSGEGGGDQYLKIPLAKIADFDELYLKNGLIFSKNSKAGSKMKTFSTFHFLMLTGFGGLLIRVRNLNASMSFTFHYMQILLIIYFNYFFSCFLGHPRKNVLSIH